MMISPPLCRTQVSKPGFPFACTPFPRTRHASSPSASPPRTVYPRCMPIQKRGRGYDCIRPRSQSHVPLSLSPAPSHRPPSHLFVSGLKVRGLVDESIANQTPVCVREDYQRHQQQQYQQQPRASNRQSHNHKYHKRNDWQQTNGTGDRSGDRNNRDGSLAGSKWGAGRGGGPGVYALDLQASYVCAARGSRRAVEHHVRRRRWQAKGACTHPLTLTPIHPPTHPHTHTHIYIYICK